VGANGTFCSNVARTFIQAGGSMVETAYRNGGLDVQESTAKWVRFGDTPIGFALLPACFCTGGSHRFANNRDLEN